MEMFTVKLTYNDGKVLSLQDVKQEYLESFFVCLSRGDMYWFGAQEEKTNAFWTNIANVRFFEVEKAADKLAVLPEEKNDDQDRTAEVCEVEDPRED